MSNTLAVSPRNGATPNVAGALAYVLGPITGVFFLVIEKEDGYVRFHAAQSVAIGITLLLMNILVSILESTFLWVPARVRRLLRATPAAE